MTEFTRDIKQLQQTASQSPTFAPPSSSLGGDIVNAIGTGLQFYQKNQAQNSLDAIAKSNAEKERKFAEGVMKYRGLRQEWESNGISKTNRSLRENNFFKEYGSEMAMGILKTTNTITGDTTSEIDTRMASAEKAKQAEVQEINMASSAYAGQILGMGEADIANLSTEDKEVYANKLEVMTREIAVQKQIAEVSDDVTAPILLQARAILQPKIDSKLNSIVKAQREGDTVGAIALGDELKTLINQTTIGASSKVLGMFPENKKQFFNAALVKSYTDDIASILDDPRIKDIISGKTTDAETTLAVKNKINSFMSPAFFKAHEKMVSGKAGQETINDYKNYIEWYSNKDLSPNGLVGKTENAILNAINPDNTPPPNPDIKTVTTDTPNAAVVGPELVIGIVNKTFDFINNADTEVISEGQGITKDAIMHNLDTGKGLSPSEMQWIESSLTYGNTGNTDKKGKGASKAVLGAPLSILARPDYKEKVKPSIDRAIANGVDPVSAITSSLDNHIRNNFGNAYTELVGLATSGMAFAPKTGVGIAVDKGRSGTYNVRDKIELQNKGGSLSFKYKSGTLGQSTDAVMITNLMNLNDSLVVINDYVKAMSNVTGTEGDLVADEVMGLLSRYANIPLQEIE